PRLPGRLGRELHAARSQLAVGRFHVVAGEGAVEEGADARLMTLGREQHHRGLRVRDAQLDPALLVVEGLVGGDLEAELLGVELQRAALVRGRDADEFDVGDHGCGLRWRSPHYGAPWPRWCL